MKTALSITSSVLGFLAGSACIAAGVYLLSFRSAAAVEAGTFDASPFDVIQHGFGVYAIGKGIAIWGMTIWASVRPLPK